MQSPKTLFIHAGMNKTGSTSIQSMFYHHREYFRKNGIHYPSTGKLVCHHDLVTNYFENEIFWNKTDNFMQLLRNDITAVNTEKCLLSSELLYPLLDNKDLAKTIKDVFKDYQIRIIVYIRRADKWLPSAYKQQIMGFRYRQLNKEFRYINHIDKLAGIKAAFGLDNTDIIIRPFEKQQFHQNDLLKDFLNVIDVPDPGNLADSTPPTNVKTHLQLDMIEYVRQMSKSVNHLEPAERAAWNKILTAYPAPKEYDDVSLFGTYENLQEVMDCYRPMYEHIARQYLARQDGIMFFDPPPPDKDHFVPYPGLSTEKIAQINGYLNYAIRKECLNRIENPKIWTFRALIEKILRRF